MDIQKVKLIVFDMSGTTIEDKNEVLDCFQAALQKTGLERDKTQINALMGWSKIEVFRHFWVGELGKRTEFLEFKAQESFGVFRQLLENYYTQNEMQPTEGCLETFAFLREKGVKIALNTGFYRKVVDILLQKMDWKIGRDIDFVIASDEVPRGRPESFMIKAAMRRFGIKDPQEVIKIGDTPVDIEEGRNAGCRTFGLTNGSHTEAELTDLDADGLYASLSEFLDDFKKGSLKNAKEKATLVEAIAV
jgi:phosphonatase-like hydrolase